MKTKIHAYLSSLNREPSTITTYTYALRRFEEIAKDGELTEENYIRFLKSIKDTKPSTQHLWEGVVRALYQFHGVSTNANLQHLAKHYIHRRSKTILDFNPEEIEKVVGYCFVLNGSLESLRDRAFVITLADSGLRISEACALQRGSINWQKRNAVITGKGDKQGIVRFSKRSIQAMKDYLALRDRTYPPSRDSLASQPIFARHDVAASKKVRPIKSGGMWKAIKNQIEAAGVEKRKVRIHDFRHYFVTRLYDATKDIKTAQVGARHESIVTTNRYTHLLGDMDAVYDEVFNQ